MLPEESYSFSEFVCCKSLQDRLHALKVRMDILQYMVDSMKLEKEEELQMLQDSQLKPEEDVKNTMSYDGIFRTLHARLKRNVLFTV